MVEAHSNNVARNSVGPLFKKMTKNNSRIHLPGNSSIKPNSPGLKTYAFWSLIILVCFLAWANMILTVVVFRVLHLGQGMESLELIPEQKIIKFYGETFFGRLFKPDGIIKGFGNTPFEIKGVGNGSVLFEVEDAKRNIQNTFKIEKNGTHIRGVKNFIVGNSFSTESPSFKLTKRSRNIEARVTSTNHITSEKNEDLSLKSDLFTKLSGSEGTLIDGKEILLTADQQVLLKSINGSVVLSGKKGVSINVAKIPIVHTRSVSTLTTQYKVCVCMPEGRLFRVPVSREPNSHAACHNIDYSSSLNPCM